MPSPGSKRSTALSRPERRHLDQVVERLAPVGETTGQIGGQAHVGGDQLVAQDDIARPGVLGEHFSQRVSFSHRSSPGCPGAV